MATKHIEEAKGWETLGPAYFSARDVAESFMAGFEAEHFAPLLKKFTTAFTEEMWDKMQNFLMCDAQANIQSHIWHDVDAVVEAILGGKQWALQRYVLPDRINAQLIRETVAKLIPSEIQDKRVSDLEEKVCNLESDLKFYRESRNY